MKNISLPLLLLCFFGYNLTLLERALASERGETIEIDASLVPQKHWEFTMETRTSIKVRGKASDILLKPVDRVSASYKDVKLVSALSKKPRPELRSMPLYPFELAVCGISGRVLVAYVVNSSGNVSDIKVIEASDERFANAVTVALAKWKYIAVRRNKEIRALFVGEFIFESIEGRNNEIHAEPGAKAQRL